MIMTVPEVLKAVREALGEFVLPELKAASWAGSNVRASMTLLAYAEDRLNLERTLLLDCNGAMRTFLEAAAGDLRLPWLDATLRSRLETALEAGGAESEGAPVERLYADNAGYKEVLVSIIRRASEARLAGRSGEDDAGFRRDLHRCLAVIEQREAETTRRSRDMAPI